MQKFFAFMASLRLGVILLVLLLIGLAAGTIVESRTSTETAGRLVYYSPWFLGLQGVLAVNVAMSLTELFPWGRKRLGFAITHAALLVILAGASLTYFFKQEGTLGLWEGQRGEVIQHMDPNGKVLATHTLPFSVQLEDFILDTYPGTMRPSGFASVVRITDSDTQKSFQARIWMNHPLHHRGYALFQSSYQQEHGREATVLAVSKDPGQTLAFAGFFTLMAGMLVVLMTRIQQSRTRESASEAARLGVKGLLAVLCMGGALALHGGDLDTLRKLPVQHDGRTMPFDTMARHTVWLVTGSHHWQGRQAMEVMTGWLNDPRSGASTPVIKVGSKKLAAALALGPGDTHVSFLSLMQNQGFNRLLMEAQMAEMQGKPQGPLTDDLMKLQSRVVALKGVLFHESVRPIPDAADPKAPWSAFHPSTTEDLGKLMAGPRPAGWPEPGKMDHELLYNRLNPERLSWVVLLVSLGFSIAAWVRRHKVLDVLAFGSLAAGFTLMTLGIGLRWSAGERIPAANMYESLLFLAWGVGLFAVIAYLFMRNRMLVLNAAFMATLTMALTDLLPMDRFIHPIAPVLSGTPWLAIHVPIIMIGYAVLALGMVVAHMQIVLATVAPQKVELVDRMHELNYWYTFIGSFMLLAGILTGSMWAASSWGRYWGWDPKEVWSLVAFLAYMAILHAKLDRMIGKFGMAVISVLSFQTILMTYLGVNFVLSSGMHSYGMGDSPILKWMVIVAASELAFLLWAVLVHRRQRTQP